MAYESAHINRFKCRYNSDNDDNAFIFQLVKAGAKLTPASATIAIYKPGSTTAVLAATAMTVSGTLLSYSIDTTTTDNFPVGTGYRARMIIKVGTGQSEVTHDEDKFFDVVKTLPTGRITYDQLVALDDRIAGMDHNGDEDFSELIEAVWGEVQFDIETRSIDGDQLLDDMIVDRSRLSIPARMLVVARLLRSKGHQEDAEYYEKQYGEKLRQMLSGGIKFDVNQDQEEDAEQGIANTIRLIG
jgi:hypothetical protein